MSAFLTEHGGTILIGAVVALVIVLIILKLRKDRKKGKTTCGCDCEGCPSAQVCHKPKN